MAPAAAAAGAAAERGPSPASSLAPGAATLVHPAAGRAGAPLSAPVGTPPMDVIRPRRTNIIMSSSGTNQPQVLWLSLAICVCVTSRSLLESLAVSTGPRVANWRGYGSFRFVSGGGYESVQSVVILGSPSRSGSLSHLSIAPSWGVCRSPLGPLFHLPTLCTC